MTEDLREHTYDDIQEYDNPLPGWWKALFWLTALFAIPYAIWHHGMGHDIFAAYAQEQQRAAEIEAKRVKLDQSDAGILALMADPAHLEAGKKIWDSNCMACHLPDGGGIVGPNMTDDFYIHVRTLADIPRIVGDGVVEKGMTPWKGILSENQIAEVAAHVATLRGTKPATPKEPQGEIIPPWPTN